MSAPQHKWPVRSSTILHDSPDLLAALVAAGWDRDSLTNTAGDEEFGVLHRTVPNPVAAAGSDRPSDTAAALTQSAGVPAGQDAGSKPTDGTPSVIATPTPAGTGLALPGSAGADAQALVPQSLPTLALVRRDARRLALAVDTEFYYPSRWSPERVILTWQFAFARPDDPEHIELLAFYAARADLRLGLGRAVAYIVERFGLERQMESLGCTRCLPGGYRYKVTRRWVVPTCDLKGAGWDDLDKNPRNWVEFDDFEAAREACADPDFKAAYDELATRMKRPSRSKLKTDEDGRPVGLAGYVNRFTDFHRQGRSLPVLVLCHAGKADLSAFTDGDFEKDVLRRVSEVQGGLVTMRSYAANPHLNRRWWRFYPLDVLIGDTMCHAPAKLKGLDDLGVVVSVLKLDLPDGYSKDRMQDFLRGDPVAFMDYASQDTVVTLCYAGALYGWNREIPVTASSAAVTVMVAAIKDYLGLGSDAEFDRVWRGVRKKRRGFRTNPETGRLDPLSDLVPISDQAALLILYARNAFKGGANGCSLVGWIVGRTFDLDLCSAYPTLMALVFDVDFTDEKCIAREWVREWADPQDFRTPFDPAYCYVDYFEFPSEVPYPCIAVNIDGRLVFPRTLGSYDGVYCTGIEIWLALKLGAKVHIQRGFMGKYMLGDDGKPTHSLLVGVKSFVEDRMAIKRAIKDGQRELEVYEQLEKTMVCSVYGKTSQNIVEKETWDAYSQRMVSIGTSRITSPTHAAMITASVRCVLMAAMNELYLMPELHPEIGSAKRYKSYSFTTDGIITDADEDTANSLTLFGLMPYLKASRMALVGNEQVWECKHEQDEFYNLTTRGNMAPNCAVYDDEGHVVRKAGVIAHNSYISPIDTYTVIDKDAKEAADREHCLRTWLSRTGRCDCTANVWSRFKAMADKTLREDFHVTQAQRALSMDSDMKRRPVESSLEGVQVHLYGETFDVANVDTVPYDTPEEAEFYHAKARDLLKKHDLAHRHLDKCLRTVEDWELYFAKVRCAKDGIERHITDLAWSRIMTAVMGHRLGVWTIPTLDDGSMTVREKCDWINTFNASNRAFTPESWKNARKQNRISQMLDRSEVEDLLEEMGVMPMDD